MTRTLLALGLLALAPSATAQDGGSSGATQRYVSDEITLSVRERPSNEAGTIGTVKSGAQVTVLENLGNESFARIRTSDGVTGWVTARYLSTEPAARTQLDRNNASLREAQARIKTLEDQLAQTRQQLEAAKPALELASENERLRGSMAETQRNVAELQQSYAAENARRKTLITGGGLVVLGLVAGLLLPLFGGRKKRGYSDF